jgi:hypothetical protein
MSTVEPSRVVRVFKNHQEQEDETRRYWLNKSIEEKMEETASLIRYAYGLKGIDVDAQRSERTIVRVQRPRR